ncbi:MAG: hypothetical protein IJ748_03535 [Bacteroidales bacterium]|nr:hypothetical protein [Bacteroidales bacterium]
MKIRHLLLGLAVVALMASCTKKAETTASETTTPSEEIQAESPVVENTEEPVAAEPVQQAAPAKATTPAAKTTVQETKAAPQVDPCEAKVKELEKYADELAAAKAKNGTPEGATAYMKLAKQQQAKIGLVSDCAKSEFKTRITNAKAKVLNTIH